MQHWLTPLRTRRRLRRESRRDQSRQWARVRGRRGLLRAQRCILPSRRRDFVGPRGGGKSLHLRRPIQRVSNCLHKCRPGAAEREKVQSNVRTYKNCRFSRSAAQAHVAELGFHELSHDNCTAVCLTNCFISYGRGANRAELNWPFGVVASNPPPPVGLYKTNVGSRVSSHRHGSSDFGIFNSSHAGLHRRLSDDPPRFLREQAFSPRYRAQKCRGADGLRCCVGPWKGAFQQSVGEPRGHRLSPAPERGDLMQAAAGVACVPRASAPSPVQARAAAMSSRAVSKPPVASVTKPVT